MLLQACPSASAGMRRGASAVLAMLPSLAAAAPPPPPPPPPNPGMVFSGTPSGVPGGSDCAVRQAAWAYGKKLQPQKGAFKDLFDALQLGNGCGVAPPPPQHVWRPAPHPAGGAGATGERVLFVEPAASGAVASGRALPADTFATVGEAIAASRSLPKPLTVALREGVHYLDATLHLGPQDSGLTLRNHAGESAVLSGGKALTPDWKPSTACAGCFEASLKGQAEAVPGLRKDGVREIRARYPNHDPELNAVIDGQYLVHDGRQGLLNLTALNATAWIPGGAVMNGMNESWPPADAATTYVIDAKDWPGVDWPDHIMSANRSGGPEIADRDTWTGEGDWGQYWIGTGGPCADRAPPAGYWCAPRAPRHIAQPTHAAGIVLSGHQLPNYPYKNPAGAVINTWGRDHWYTNIFELGAPAPQNSTAGQPNSTGYYFTRGGTQGGEGVVGGEVSRRIIAEIWVAFSQNLSDNLGDRSGTSKAYWRSSTSGGSGTKF